VERKIKNPAPAPNHVRFRTNAGFKEAIQGTIPGLFKIPLCRDFMQLLNEPRYLDNLGNLLPLLFDLSKHFS
jgi:hypothetical protein